MKIKFTKIPIYNRSFTISCDREEAAKIYKKFIKEDQVYYPTTLGCLTHLGMGKYMLACFDGDLDTLSHEITHLALACLNNGDDYDFREQQESLAYLIGYLTGVIYKKLGISTKFKFKTLT